MTQDRMRRIITAITSAVTALIVALLAYAIYQWVAIAQYNKKNDYLKAEIYRLEMELEGYGDEPGLRETADYLQTEAALQKLYQEWLELQGKK